jgi:hypothetical protein
MEAQKKDRGAEAEAGRKIEAATPAAPQAGAAPAPGASYLGGVMVIGKLELIYEYVDNEVRVNKMAQPYPAREIAVWFAEGDPFGSWRYVLLLAKSEVYLREEWVPAPGYRWQEVRIYRVVEE